MNRRLVAGVAFLHRNEVQLLDDLEFGVFQDDGRGPLWKASVTEVNEAKRLAQALAAECKQEVFVYNFRNGREIARSFPTRSESDA